ncbi:MAG: segregation/condensation protein A, partial [Patescibacteria group bacterium]
DVLARLKPILELPRLSMAKTVSIREKIEQIRSMLTNGGKFGFRHLLEVAQSRTEIIVSFLAILELTKQRELFIVQQNNFEEISIEKL